MFGIVSICYNQPNLVIVASNVNAFKNKLDQLWENQYNKLNCI